MATLFTPAELDAFRDAAQSLKLYRRAELISDDGDELIEKLYVDPLPNEHVLNTLLKPNTTFLVGRKGTGKSTVFQRAQYELRKKSDVTTAYIDIKSVYESSQVDPEIMALTSKYDGVLPVEQLERLLLNRHFVSAILGSIRSELQKRVESTFWSRVRELVGGSMQELFAEMDQLEEHANSKNFESVLGAYESSKKIATSSTKKSSAGGSVKVRLSASPEADIGLTASRSTTATREEETEQADVLVRAFNVREFISRLKVVLQKCGIRHLYVFLDDFSELPEPAMRVVVDALLAPLNNWSDELIKFKIAAYPTRIYYGEIDRAKVDEVNLDLFNLYGAADLAAMEEKAIDFTRRLIQRRLEHYGAVPATKYLDSPSTDDIWRQLFYATMANPRNVGYLLYFAYEEALLYGRQIGSGTLRASARKYYEEKIESSFEMNRFLRESFAERSSIFSLKDLLDDIVERARDLRRSDSQVLRELEGRAPTSHFHVKLDYESLLASLELNFFITKYFVMSDRDGAKVAVYALNYGLCQQQTIEFGRPVGSREKRYRQYYAERIFDYTPVLQSYVRTNQEIVCDQCGSQQEIENLTALRTYGMLCPVCKEGTCELINLSRKYEDTLRSVAESSLLPQVELGILHTLGSEGRPLNATDVAGELDCSYQLIGRRVRNLDDRGLVNRDEYESNKRVYKPTKLANEIYFSAAAE